MKNIRWLSLILAAALALSGCSLDVESYLRPPKVGDQQQAVQTALGEYIRDTYGGVRYTAEYPVEGDSTAAYLLCDRDGFAVTDSDDATLAVAFYSVAFTTGEIHVNLLERRGKQWVSVADTVGAGVDISQVATGDLDEDGQAELITGWTTYDARVRRLAVYGITNGITLLDGDNTYSAMCVQDITADGGDDLLLLTAAQTGEVTASLYRLQNKDLAVADTVSLDGGILGFGDMTLCRLAEGVHGLFVEGTKENAVVTELIYYDHTGLCAPFYDPATNSTPVTTRTRRLAATDIDGDAMVEIPTHQMLPDHTEQDVGGTVTLWRVWDYTTGQWRDHSAALVNPADGYMVTLDDWSHLDTEYDKDTRTLTLLNATTHRRYLWVTVGNGVSEAPLPGLKQVTLFAGAGEGDTGYHAWYDPAVLEAEKVRYMITRLNKAGGGQE